jgi:hypothetical protein
MALKFVSADSDNVKRGLTWPAPDLEDRWILESTRAKSCRAQIKTLCCLSTESCSDPPTKYQRLASSDIVDTLTHDLLPHWRYRDKAAH